jgi:hypothetical protein
MMRYLLIVPLLAAACSDVPSSGLHYDSVRERVSEVPTWLYIQDEASSGTVTARRRARDGWVDCSTQLAISHGHLRATIDDNGQLAIDELEIAVAPIALDGMYDRPAQLQDVILRLAQPVRGEAAWTSDDDATATLPMVFDVGLAIAVDGKDPVRLVTQRRPPERVAVALGGNGDRVDASLDIDASGELWSWDGLVQVTEVAFSLNAATAY